MTATKDQERKALDQIKKIVEGLGPDSYIATAFAGCFEIAEANIENDFADSMKERYEQSREDAAHFKAAADSFSAELDKLRSEHASLKDELKNVKERSACHSKQADEAVAERAVFEVELADAKLEIVKLKAKLYDLMVGA